MKQKAIQRLKQILTMVMAYVPKRLPETPAAYTAWEQGILDAGGFPVNDSFRHAIATQVLHLTPSVHVKSQMFFVNNLRRSIANQVAFSVIQDTKGPKPDEKAV